MRAKPRLKPGYTGTDTKVQRRGADVPPPGCVCVTGLSGCVAVAAPPTLRWCSTVTEKQSQVESSRVKLSRGSYVLLEKRRLWLRTSVGSSMPGCSTLRAKVTLGGILVPVAASAFIRCSGTGLVLREGRRVLYKNQCIYHYSGCQVATVTGGLYRGHRPVLQKWRVFNSRGKEASRCCMFHVWSAHLQLVAEERFPRTPLSSTGAEIQLFGHSQPQHRSHTAPD